MDIEHLEIGGLYTTENKRKEAIELFNNPHYAYERDNMYTDNVLLPNDYFVLLEIRNLNNMSLCLKVLTPDGTIGWTTELYLDKSYSRVNLNKLA
jgi:hypothetical protein